MQVHIFKKRMNIMTFTKTKLAHKITGVLAVVAAATALGASAQTAVPTEEKPVVPPVTAPATTPPVDGTTAPATDPAAAQAAPAMDDVAPAAPAVAEDANAAKGFMREAYMANEFSIAAAQLAATNGESAEVKAAAQQVLDNGLKTREGMVAAIQASTSDMHFDQAYTDDYNMKLGELKAASGADFDTKYVATQGEVTDHAESVYTAYAASGTDESVKTFAANTLPTLSSDGDKLDSVAQGGN